MHVQHSMRVTGNNPLYIPNELIYSQSNVKLYSQSKVKLCWVIFSQMWIICHGSCIMIFSCQHQEIEAVLIQSFHSLLEGKHYLMFCVYLYQKLVFLISHATVHVFHLFFFPYFVHVLITCARYLVPSATFQ